MIIRTCPEQRCTARTIPRTAAEREEVLALPRLAPIIGDMLPSKDVLRSRYNTFSNEALLAAHAAGPGPYSPLAWEVITELVTARGLGSAAAPASPPPVRPASVPVPSAKAVPSAPVGPASAPVPKAPPRPAPPPPVQRLDLMPTRPPAAPARAAPVPEAAPASPEAPAALPSPYLAISRARRDVWPGDQPLPTTARDILAFAAMVFGVAGVGIILLAVTKRGPAAVLDLRTGELAGTSVLSLVYALTARRPPSAVAWAVAMLYGAVAPTLILAPLGGADMPRWPRYAIGGVVGLLWVIYFARRRGIYGLKPWRWLL